MLTVLRGKGGNLCSQARSGEIRCPLIVRPTSEDVITGNIFQSLGYLSPRWWLPDLLNAGLGANRFRRQFFRDLKIRLWQNQPCYPKELLPWYEGSTQVDALISFENPPTTIYIEAKYGSSLSTSVAGDDGRSGYPSDQLIRNIRVGLLQAGYFDQGEELFDQTPRDFVVLVLAPFKGNPLVERYRNRQQLRGAIPHSDRLIGLPQSSFVGEIDYDDIQSILTQQARWMSVPERRVVADLTEYLEFKRSNLPNKTALKLSGPTGPAGEMFPGTPTNPLEILSVG